MTYTVGPTISPSTISATGSKQLRCSNPASGPARAPMPNDHKRASCCFGNRSRNCWNASSPPASADSYDREPGRGKRVLTLSGLSLVQLTASSSEGSPYGSLSGSGAIVASRAENATGFARDFSHTTAGQIRPSPDRLPWLWRIQSANGIRMRRQFRSVNLLSVRRRCVLLPKSLVPVGNDSRYAVASKDFIAVAPASKLHLSVVPASILRHSLSKLESTPTAKLPYRLNP